MLACLTSLIVPIKMRSCEARRTRLVLELQKNRSEVSSKYSTLGILVCLAITTCGYRD